PRPGTAPPLRRGPPVHPPARAVPPHEVWSVLARRQLVAARPEQPPYPQERRPGASATRRRSGCRERKQARQVPCVARRTSAARSHRRRLAPPATRRRQAMQAPLTHPVLQLPLCLHPKRPERVCIQDPTPAAYLHRLSAPRTCLPAGL